MFVYSNHKLQYDLNTGLPQHSTPGGSHCVQRIQSILHKRGLLRQTRPKEKSQI